MGKVMSLAEAQAYRQALAAAGMTVVFTNGLFDLLHIGHLDYLERARALGDALIIGLNSDRSARALKGEKHPILPEQDRGRLLAALRVTDAVVIFDDETAANLIAALKPDIYVKGGDYAHKTWPERDAALALGCRVELIPFSQGHSTTNLVQTIVQRFSDNGPSGR